MLKKILGLAVTSIDLDLENPRFEGQEINSQREAIDALLSLPRMDEKIARLTKHIIEKGIDPTELPLVLKHPEKNKRYVVVEGNRRILALKILLNPNLCPSKFSSLQKKVKKLNKNYLAKIPKKIQCSLVNSRNDAYPWIDLKHTGENEGSGRVQWDGRATDTFRQSIGNKKSAGRIILDYIESDSRFNENLKDYARSIPITNITRLFGASEAKNLLGYRIKDSQLELLTTLEKFRCGVESVIHRFQEDNIKVSDIYDSGDRAVFFKTRISEDSLPSPEEIGETYKKIDIFVEHEESKKGKKSKPKQSKTVPPANLRRNLINYTLKISHSRINAVYLELKNKINIHETPNSGSVLFRVFLELSTDYALKELKLNTKNPISIKNATLTKKVNTVVDKLVEMGRLEKKVGQDIKHVEANSKYGTGTVDGLHRYVHGTNHPIPTELNDSMENWSPYVKAIWEYDHEKNN